MKRQTLNKNAVIRKARQEVTRIDQMFYALHLALLSGEAEPQQFSELMSHINIMLSNLKVEFDQTCESLDLEEEQTKSPSTGDNAKA